MVSPMNAIAHRGDSETASCLKKHSGDLLNLLRHCEQRRVQWIITHTENSSFRKGIFFKGSGENIPLLVKWLKNYQNINKTHLIERHNIFTEGNINFPQRGHQCAVQPRRETNPVYGVHVVTWLKLKYEGGHMEDWVLLLRSHRHLKALKQQMTRAVKKLKVVTIVKFCSSDVIQIWIIVAIQSQGLTHSYWKKHKRQSQFHFMTFIDELENTAILKELKNTDNAGCVCKKNPIPLSLHTSQQQSLISVSVFKKFIL